MAVPAIILGITLSEVRPAAELTEIGLGSSLLFNGLVQVLLGVTPQAYDVILHPTAFAGWIGFLVTAFNLLPAGQLDGGHIVYSLCGRWHRLVTLLCVLALLPMGLYWPGWWVWAFVIFCFSDLTSPGVRDGACLPASSARRGGALVAHPEMGSRSLGNLRHDVPSRAIYHLLRLSASPFRRIIQPQYKGQTPC